MPTFNARWGRRFKAGFHVYGIYFTGDPSADERPALALNRGDRSYIIQMDEMHRFADSSGYPTRDLVRTASNIADILGLGSTRSAAVAVADAIVDCTTKLFEMPPNRPESAAGVEAMLERHRVKIKADGETLVDAT